MARPSASATIALLATCACGPAPLRAQEATGATILVYHCTDARGRVALQDAPCAKGQQQQVQTVIRPRAPPASTHQHVPADAAPQAPAPPPQVVVVQPPRPLYECATPDGETYTSDSDAGNPRWVPLWTLGYPGYAEGYVARPGAATIRYADGHVDARLRSGGVERVVVPTAAGYGAGTWVRDDCHALPQAEVCARLRDDLDALRKRFFNAMPSERARIDVRERGIVARLDSDCGGR